MDSASIFTMAMEYEKKIRDLYVTAAEKVDDERGKKIFSALAEDEQSHVDFLQYSLEQLQTDNAIDGDRLLSNIPAQVLEDEINRLKAEIPDQMLGDIKTVLGTALKLEKETSAFYKDARAKCDDEVIGKILDKFIEIEDRHVDVVQLELDHAMSNGMWFDFMEINLEAE